MWTETPNWRTGVTVVRSAKLNWTMGGATGPGRATAFEFAGSGGRATWIGTVRMQPNAQTGTHHHGRHEVATYVAKGRGRIRWGARLEFAADIGPGDLVYFAPNVPHQEQNLDARDTLDFVVVRSDSERIAISLDVEAVEAPEMVF
jgi:uncharacterized RmlC-like cupin family protein